MFFRTVSQHFTNESNNMQFNNIKNIEKSKTLKKDNVIKNKINKTSCNDQSNFGAKLSFLSSLSSK